MKYLDTAERQSFAAGAVTGVSTTDNFTVAAGRDSSSECRVRRLPRGCLRRHGLGAAFQRRVDLVPVVVELRVQDAVLRVPAGQRFDPRRDPRTEKTGWKQWNKAYPRVWKSRGKPALFSRKLAEGGPIESSHA